MSWGRIPTAEVSLDVDVDVDVDDDDVDSLHFRNDPWSRARVCKTTLNDNNNINLFNISIKSQQLSIECDSFLNEQP